MKEIKKKEGKIYKRDPVPWEGRPTKYHDWLIKKVDEYLLSCEDEEKQVVKFESDKGTWYETKLVVKYPTIEWFADYIWVNEDSVNERRKLYKPFSVAIDKIRKNQKNRLLVNWLSNNYNARFAKFLLSANHWMSEKTVTEQQWSIDINIDINTASTEDLLKIIQGK